MSQHVDLLVIGTQFYRWPRVFCDPHSKPMSSLLVQTPFISMPSNPVTLIIARYVGCATHPRFILTQTIGNCWLPCHPHWQWFNILFPLYHEQLPQHPYWDITLTQFLRSRNGRCSRCSPPSCRNRCQQYGSIRRFHQRHSRLLGQPIAIANQDAF